MKAQKSILMLVLLGVVISVSVNANGNNSEAGSEARAEAVKELRHQLSDVFKNVPYEYLEEGDNCCVILTFRVTEDQTISEINIEGDNEVLVNYVKIVLHDYNVKADKALAGNKCRIELRFKDLG